MAVNLGSPTFRWFLFSSAVLSNNAVAVGFAAGPIIVVGRAITVIYFNFDNENGSETLPSSPSYSTCNYQSGYCCACSGNAGFKNVVIQPSTPFLLHPPPHGPSPLGPRRRNTCLIFVRRPKNGLERYTTCRRIIGECRNRPILVSNFSENKTVTVRNAKFPLTSTV